VQVPLLDDRIMENDLLTITVDSTRYCKGICGQWGPLLLKWVT